MIIEIKRSIDAGVWRQEDLERERSLLRIYMKNRDNIYEQKLREIKDFSFGKEIADVFEDMLCRSIPGYQLILDMISVLTARYARENTNLYDLGCSLGASALAMQAVVKRTGCHIMAVDNSQAMIDQCKRIEQRKDPGTPTLEFICQDACDVKITNASVVVMNFTLQFIDREKKIKILQGIYDGLKPKGLLILSEKICFSNKKEDAQQTRQYEEFKRMNRYSDQEIAQKKEALKNILKLDPLEEHRKRLEGIGFSCVDVWYQCFNFASMLAIK